jgi:hypothetical protein
MSICFKFALAAALLAAAVALAVKPPSSSPQSTDATQQDMRASRALATTR